MLLLSKNSCFVKTGERFFQISWPSHNVLTLNVSENVDVFKSRWQHHCGSLVQLFEQWGEIVSERAQIILISLHPHFQVSWFLRPELYEDLITHMYTK